MDTIIVQIQIHSRYMFLIDSLSIQLIFFDAFKI